MSSSWRSHLDLDVLSVEDGKVIKRDRDWVT
ncbi:hypothetical protein ZBT109_1195 [Zymobacter palmae]|uniref:Uncharacterized protein n=1 Tax=Zymobacter palmae TaxID=33074 RepID=A0A348HEA3_9GAMM|nr:hypothetical protein ZBT109_1195 [Zymobacter palmae]